MLKLLCGWHHVKQIRQMWLSYHGHAFLCELLLSTMKLAFHVVAVPFCCSAVRQCQVRRSCHHHHQLVRTLRRIPPVTGTPSQRRLQHLCMMPDQHCHGGRRLQLVRTHAALHLIINSLIYQTPQLVSSCRCCSHVVCISFYKFTDLHVPAVFVNVCWL